MNSVKENDETFAEQLEASLNFQRPQQGDMLSGTVVSISGEDAFVAFGGPTEAVMSSAEIEGKDVGATVEGIVVETSPLVRISRKLVARKASMVMLRQAMESGIPVEGKIGGRNKGGFDVSVSGLRAFCPLSQIELGKVENPDAYVGRTFEFLITELSDDARKLVVSRVALLRREQAARSEEVRKNLTVGSIVRGTVRTLMPYGAFIDLGGVEGLLHVSEMSRRRVNDPKEIFSVGQEIEAKIVRIDESGRRISLSTRELEPDPWQGASERYRAGMPFSGRIARKTDFGLFVEVEPGIDGLLHQSQLAYGMRMDDESLAVGSTVTGWVREVDPEKRRLSLAMREVAAENPWEDAEKTFPVGSVVEGTVDRAGSAGVFVSVAPGLTGLVPPSEMSLPPGSDPAKLHKPGDKLIVKVLSVEPQRRRLGLSIEGAKSAAERNQYLDYVGESRPEPTQSKSAMALALEKALRK
jgi:small subunit ribosomal protein S1